jgi:hypothetical protein
VAKDRALYYGFLLLTVAMAVVRWTIVVTERVHFEPEDRWQVLLHPMVVLPLALAGVFGWRVVRKTGRLWWR